MTHHIRIVPSGHEFVSEGHNSILEAGLSAGLRLEYGCSNGNCGQCLVRVVSGEAEKIRHHDFVIGEARKANGHLLMCCNSAQTEMVIEAREASGTDEIPRQQLTARVKNVSFVNDNVALVHLKTPRTSRLRFLAGQHVILGGNGIPTAIHTIASCPCDDMHLHFQIPRDTTNDFSNHVFNTLKAGDVIDVNGPDGDFILDGESSRSLVFIAWRSGFAPIRSLIEHAMALEVADTIKLVWIAEDKQDLYLDNLCRSWADALDEFHYFPFETTTGNSLTEIIPEAISKMNIEQTSLPDYDFYIAGNELFSDNWKKNLLDSGLPAEQLTLDSLFHK